VTWDGRTDVIAALEEFWDDHVGPSMILPDGWHGRPFDSPFRLAGLCEVDGQLVLDSQWPDEQLRLSTPLRAFVGLPNPHLDETRPIDSISLLTSGAIQWRSGGHPPNYRRYAGGTVMFVASTVGRRPSV